MLSGLMAGKLVNTHKIRKPTTDVTLWQNDSTVYSTTIVNNSPITQIVQGNLKSSLDVSRGLSGKVK